MWETNIAIADGLLCLRFDGEAGKLSFAKEESWTQYGTTVSDDYVWTTRDIEAWGQIGRDTNLMSRACKAVASIVCVLSD